jgi:predicted RNA-binding Zn ribbon-like protein
MLHENELNLREKWLCLDFVNTNDWHASSQPVESLFHYADLAKWCQKVGLISLAEAQELQRLAEGMPAEAEATLAMAIALREAIYRIITAHVNGKPAGAVDLDLLNAEITRAAEGWKLKLAPDGFAWEWDTRPDDLAGMLGPIARSAAGLLTSPELYRVGVCADEDGCGFAFFDTSRNRSRRWCSMEDCGNRAKAQRHYQRQKEAGIDW